MKRRYVALIVVAAVAAAALSAYRYYAGSYNQMVSLGESVDSRWAQVENQYQRRLDLIPNLVATVKGYAAHETDVFTRVAEARAKAGGVMQVSSDILSDPDAFRRFQQAQAELSGSLQRLLAVAESYPELHASESFLALQDQLEGTENRISVERNRFNEAVRAYNTFIRQFPRSLIAGSAGFAARSYFQADAEASRAPSVAF
ncbi:LemA family protein [Treponema endosymbiont of Eucomonympha sp.]|uniref:LemA family protein n=1 Tax=Treponema endosymbiont of Eucomonympha sp. TaxID=1580831 RepID=UPI0007519F94|nr:LemA family protein [Treponema endosymbiont of Eucomonympha sp.]